MLQKIKTPLLILIIVIGLLILLFAYNYFNFLKSVEAPVVSPTGEQNLNSQDSGFRGPTSAPYVQGPSSPPPGQ